MTKKKYRSSPIAWECIPKSGDNFFGFLVCLGPRPQRFDTKIRLMLQQLGRFSTDRTCEVSDAKWVTSWLLLAHILKCKYENGKWRGLGSYHGNQHWKNTNLNYWPEPRHRYLPPHDWPPELPEPRGGGSMSLPVKFGGDKWPSNSSRKRERENLIRDVWGSSLGTETLNQVNNEEVYKGDPKFIWKYAKGRLVRRLTTKVWTTAINGT